MSFVTRRFYRYAFKPSRALEFKRLVDIFKLKVAQYIYNSRAVPPIEAASLARLVGAAGRLAEKYRRLPIDALDISDHTRISLKDAAGTIDELMTKYVHLLAWLEHPRKFARAEVLIDYGGGHGLLSCLGKEAGYSHVIYNDIFDLSCRDAKVVGESLGCAADSYVCGDVDAVFGVMGRNEARSLGLVSVNVIEHIYDLDTFFAKAKQLTAGPLRMVMSTSANTLNPLVRRRHFQQHREWEFTDGPHPNSSPRDSVRAFLSLRREIVGARGIGLSGTEIDTLAELTRGLKRDDIESCVVEYQASGKLPPKPHHPTNTCDPITGSWQERLLESGEVRTAIQERDAVVVSIGGYYGGKGRSRFSRSVKQVAAFVLNWCISLLGSRGVVLSPSVIFHIVIDRGHRD